MTEEDDFTDETKQKIEDLEENLEDLKREYSEENPNRLFLYIRYQDFPDETGAGLLFLDPNERIFYYLNEYDLPKFDMNDFQSPSRQATEKFYQLGFDRYKRIELAGREYVDWNDCTEYHFKITVPKKQAKVVDGSWIKKSNLDNYVDEKTYLL